MQRLLITPNEAQSRLRVWPEHGAAAGSTMPDLAPDLLQQPEVLPRFAACYTQLRALPRRVRRALQRKWKQSLAGVALLFALGATPGQAATIPVSATCSLINAITAANTDTATGGCPRGNGADTIRLPVGSTQTLTAVNNSTYGPTGLPVISSQITIEGRNSTIRRNSSDPDLFRIFAINGTGALTLKDTTIRGGVASGSNTGGGIYNYNGVVMLEGSTVSGNTGRGVANSAFFNSGTSTVTLSNSTVSGNTGGGVANSAIYADLVVTLTNSTVSGNTASGAGGGVATSAEYSSVTVTLTNSTVSGNTAGDAGGGIANRGGIFASSTVTLTNSAVFGNTAGDAGGGVANFSPDRGGARVTLTNSTVSGNTAGGAGGGVANNAEYDGAFAGVTVSDSTISGNTASGDGGGIANYVGRVEGGGGNAGVTVTNSTLSGNTAGGNGGGVFNDAALSGCWSALICGSLTVEPLPHV